MVIGEEELVGYGFSKAAQWACLYDLWQQESGWNVYAQNPSGAYGIPQSLPGNRMAMFGSDYLNDPTAVEFAEFALKDRFATPPVAGPGFSR